MTAHQETRSLLVAPGFEGVADAFQQTIAADGRTGAALAVWKDGAAVLDLWAGSAVPDGSMPYRPTTLTKIWSCTKGVAAVLIAMLIERGDLPSFDTPIAEVWPEFGAHGKDRISIGDVLAHRAGLSALRDDLPWEALLDDRVLAQVLARQEPLWEPGTHHMYHAVTIGGITAELVRRATGRSIGQFLATEVAGPLGADVRIGLPASEDHRLAVNLIEDGDAPGQADNDEAAYWTERAIPFGPFSTENVNDPSLHQAELAGFGGVATASGLAKFWSATVVETDGIRLIGDGTADALRVRRSWGPGYFAGKGETSFQAWGAGVMVPSDWDPYLSARSFGHDGAGGQVAFADLDARIGFAYLTNKFGDWQRGISIVTALREALA
jgi:CubicO group peptidase (beta-lactamase class C family)